MPVGKAYDPKFHTIIHWMQEKILSGEWEPGHKIPSISQLRKEHGWNYSTLRGAVLVLKTRGLLEGKQGDGIFVTQPGSATEADQAWLERFIGVQSFVGPVTATLNGRTFRNPNVIRSEGLGI